MTNPVAKQFIQALQESEDKMDVAPIVSLFHERATLSNLRSDKPQEGLNGAQKFWKDYLSVFQRIHSDFSRVIETEDAATLEWVSDGSLSNGEPIHYKGISVLEIDGDKVTAFRTYYDSAAFLPQGAKHKE